MASKVQKAKDAQGYDANPPKRVCMNCAHRTFRFDFPAWMYEEKNGGVAGKPDEWKQEYDQRCGLGGFAIKKSATCNEWKQRESVE